jgi:RNA polymerase sigma factor (sigma-70 family)
MTSEQRLTLFNENKGLAYSISGRYEVGNYKEDLQQIALMELWECTGRYSKDKGSFSGYCYSCIENKVKQSFMEYRYGIRKGKVSFMVISYIIKNKDLGEQEIYDRLKKETLLKIDRESFRYLYEQANNGMSDFGENENNIESEENIEDRVEQKEIAGKVIEILDRRGRNGKIAKEWLMGIAEDREVKLVDVGKKYGVSKERVRQIVDKERHYIQKIIGK